MKNIARPLAHKDGINLVFNLLMASGAMCPKCGFGTRVTSKKWAKCKKCGERVERVNMEDIKVVETYTKLDCVAIESCKSLSETIHKSE